MSNDVGETSTARPRPDHPPQPRARGRVLCPYCGEISTDVNRCTACTGYFDPLSRQASQNAMGAWFIRDAARPFRPGCSYETLKDLVRRGKVTADTVIRGPTTRQFWTFAGRAPSIANLLGRCHNCHAEVKPDAYMCAACGAAFTPESDRQHLGLAPIHLLPNQATPEVIAAVSAAREQRHAHAPPPAPSRATIALPGRSDGDYARLRRQIIAQWAALILLFVAVAGLAAWLLTAFARQQRPAAAATLPAETAPATPSPAPQAPPPAPPPEASDQRSEPPADPEAPDEPAPIEAPPEEANPESAPPAPEPPPAAPDDPPAAAKLVSLLASENPDPAAVRALLAAAGEIDADLRGLAERRLDLPRLRVLP